MTAAAAGVGECDVDAICAWYVWRAVQEDALTAICVTRTVEMLGAQLGIDAAAVTAMVDEVCEPLTRAYGDSIFRVWGVR